MMYLLYSGEEPTQFLVFFFRVPPLGVQSSLCSVSTFRVAHGNCILNVSTVSSGVGALGPLTFCALVRLIEHLTCNRSLEKFQEISLEMDPGLETQGDASLCRHLRVLQKRQAVYPSPCLMCSQESCPLSDFPFALSLSLSLCCLPCHLPTP